MDLFALKAVLGLDTSGYDKGINDAKGKAEGFGSVLKKGFSTAAKVGAGAITAASAAVVVFGKSAVEAGQTFDTSMSQVAATMGYTVEQLNTEGSEAATTFNTLRDFAQKMGSETAFSASEAADALNYMALAGYDADTSMKMLPNVLNLASAGAMSLASASDMVTDAQSALGLTLDETSALVDKMATTASKSNTSVSQLGDAILTIGGTASVLKGGTTELSAALGILADNGIKGAEGGTHLRNVLLALSAPTDTAAETLASLGVTTTDASGNLRSLESIMGDLDKALAGMGEADKAKIISQIFNKTDIAAVNALLSTSGSRWKELSSAIDSSKGSAEAMAKTQLDNLAGDITLFKSALEGAQIAISDGLTPTLRTFVQFGSSSLSTLTNAYKEGGLSGLTDAFSNVVSEGLGKLLDMVPKVVQAGTSLLTALIRGIISSAPRLVAAIPKLLKSLVTGIAKGLPQIGKAGKQLVDELTNSIRNALKTGFDIQSLLANFLTGGRVKYAAGNTVTSFVKQYVKPALTTALQNLFGDGSAADGIVKAFNQVVFSVTGVVNTLKNAFEPTVEAVQTLYDTVKGLFSGQNTLSDVRTSLFNVFKSAWNSIQSIDWSYIATLIGTAVRSVYSLVVDWATNMYNKVADAIRSVDWYQVGTDAWNLVKSAFSAVVTYFKTLFGGENGTGVRGTIEKGIDWAGLGSAIWNYITAAFSAVVDFFKPVFEDAKTAIENIKWAELGTNIWDGIKGAFSAVGSWFMQRFESVKLFVLKINWAQLGTDIWNAIKSAFLAIGSWLKERFDTAKNYVLQVNWAQLGTDIWGGIKTAFFTIGSWLKERFESAKNFVLQVDWNGLGTSIGDTVKGALDTVKSWLPESFQTALDTVSTFFTTTVPQFISTAMTWFTAFRYGILNPLGDYIGGKFIEAWTAIKDYWENDLGPGLQGLIDAFSGFIQTILGGNGEGVTPTLKELSRAFHDIWLIYIKPLADYVSGTFSTVWDTFKGVLSGLIEFLTGVFSGDWEKAWSGLVKAFGSIFDGIKELVKKPLNAVINALNGLITKVELTLNKIVRGINSTLKISIPRIMIDPPDWLKWTGAQPFGFPGFNWSPHMAGVTFGRIPALANGGILGNGGHAIVGEAGPEYLRVINGKAVVTPTTGGSAGNTYNNTINIYQQPGESAEELAERVQRVLARQERQRRTVYA